MNMTNEINLKNNNPDNVSFNSYHFGYENTSQNKNPFILNNKKQMSSFFKEELDDEKYKNSQTANKANNLLFNEKHSEALKFSGKEPNHKQNQNENEFYNNLKEFETEKNPFENNSKNIKYKHIQDDCERKNSDNDNLEDYYNKRLNNLRNYYDRKQMSSENNEENKNANINHFDKKNTNNRKNIYEDDDNFNAKPAKRGQNVDYEDFANSIYNVNKKKKINNNNYYKNKIKNTQEDEEEVSSYNIYANRKPKRPNRYNRSDEFENEGFSVGGEMLNKNNNNYKNNYKKTDGNYQNQMYLKKKNQDNEDEKFNEDLENTCRASNYLLNNKHNNQNKFINKNKGKESNDVTNKYSVRQKFVPPKMNNSSDKFKLGDEIDKYEESSKYEELDKKLKGCDPKLIELIESEILSTSPDVKWDDIAGLEFAKKTIKEIIIWPMLRPDIFKGIRKPPKGLLLFGPPGTGKTMIAKAIASESKSSFFNISASSLMSKWIGESERLVRTLFALASFHQPSVVFIDEIDSILTSRSENENESSRRIKTEFLVQLDGAGTNQDDRILIIGATNRPQEIDEAFIRRLSKRLYIPLPSKASRKQLFENVINKESEKNNKYSIDSSDLNEILRITKGYSGSDLMGVCREAAMMPIRSIEDILSVSLDNIRDVCIEDFKAAVQLVKPSVSEKTIGQYVQWNKDFGSFNFEEKDE